MTDTTLNRFFASGTNAARVAYTPSPPTPASGPGTLYGWFETDTKTFWLYDVDDLTWYESSGGASSITFTASEAIAAGDLVNLFNDSGTGKMRLADASTTGKEADGFSPNAVSMGASGVFSQSGEITGLSGLTLGPVWLSDTVPGGVTSTAPATVGYTMQAVGKAMSATTMIFIRGEPVNL